MINAIAILILLGAALANPVAAQPADDVTREILALERQVMEGWLRGDPGPALAIADRQVTFIHEAIGKRLEGVQALKALYDQYRGVPLFESYEIRNPIVQATADGAILTYLLEQRIRGSVRHWNGTQIFRKTERGWIVIHSHWSSAKIE